MIGGVAMLHLLLPQSAPAPAKRLAGCQRCSCRYQGVRLGDVSYDSHNVIVGLLIYW